MLKKKKPLSALFRPNANFTFVGDVLICRAARDLEASDAFLLAPLEVE